MPQNSTRQLTRGSRNINSQLAGDDFEGFQTDEGNEVVENDPMEKDEVEEELERLVFGDDAAFKRGLELHGAHDLDGLPDGTYGAEAEEGNGEESADQGLEHLDDADV